MKPQRIASFFLFLLGCGGAVVTGDGGVPEASTDAPSSGCPASEPSPGSSCQTDALQCEYGTGDRWTCNDVLTCKSGAWSLTASNDVCSSNPVGCPSTLAGATGDCTDRGLECDYSTSSHTNFCTCGLLGGPVMPDGGITWYCDGASTVGCPALRPRIGDSCNQSGLECSYDLCGFPSGLSFQCSATTMTWIMGQSGVCG